MLGTVARMRGIDFRDYRRETIVRGITARMQAQQQASADAYANILDGNDGEVSSLLETLVIPCSSFFRNSPVFQALESQVLPRLALDHLELRPLRAWCVGIATGEEAWSLAMLLDSLSRRPGSPDWQLLASDLDRRSLRIAELGRYPQASVAPIPPELRRRYLTEHGDGAEVDPELRRRVRFAHHDLLGAQLAPTESVVASFDLVLCRNVLIYFDRRLQEKALERMAATLEPGGALILGEVESLTDGMHARLLPYPGLDPDLRIFTARPS